MINEERLLEIMIGKALLVLGNTGLLNLCVSGMLLATEATGGEVLTMDLVKGLFRSVLEE